MRNKLVALASFLAIVFVDQISKFFALKYFSYATVINEGGGFSFRVGGLDFIYVSIISLIIFIVLFYVIDRKLLSTFPFWLVVSGAFSNIIDRLTLHGVVDFIDFKFWPSFNIADSCILIGCVLLVFKIFRTKD